MLTSAPTIILPEGAKNAIIAASVFERSFLSHDVGGGRQLRQFSPLETPPAFRVTLSLRDGAPAAWPCPAVAPAPGAYAVRLDLATATRGCSILLDMVSDSVSHRGG